MEKEARRNPVLNLPGQVPGLLLDPGPVRMASASGQMDATRTDLDEEEDVELGQSDRIDHKGVGLVTELEQLALDSAVPFARRQGTAADSDDGDWLPDPAPACPSA
jgi:hypothetical protein